MTFELEFLYERDVSTGVVSEGVNSINPSVRVPLSICLGSCGHHIRCRDGGCCSDKLCSLQQYRGRSKDL